jgi:L-lactate dehydrogenase complex protein LldG
MSDLAELLGTLRRALGRTAEAAVPPVPEAPADLSPGVGHDLVAEFVARAKDAGVEVIAGGDTEAATRALIPEGACVHRDDAPWPGDPFAVDVAIVAARFGIAASGSVVLLSPAVAPLPPMTAATLVVRLAAANIVPTLRAALTASAPDAGQATRLLVTGPSKTADIEGILITGVHGPGRMIIVLEPASA